MAPRPLPPPRRVVATGLGVISPLGIGVEKNWNALMAGASGIGPITHFDTAKFDARIAGEVRDFSPENYMEKKETRRMERFAHFAVASARIALEDGAYTIPPEEAARVGVVIGVGMGGLPAIERTRDTLVQQGPSRVTPFFIPLVIPNMAAGHVSIQFGAKGPNLCTTTACAAGAHAIGEASRLIQQDHVDVILAGGAEATVSPLAVAGFDSMKALSRRNGEPQKASRPFERDRDGFVLAEGGAVLLLEELEHARRRGARIYAELIGYGLNGDAHHITTPAPNGEGAARCMRLTLDDAGIAPVQVDYINAHGTSTKYNDANETAAIKTVFGPHASSVAISSTKSMTGHLLGAAGAVEAVYSILTIVRGTIPPTVNYENPDPECDLDYVPNTPRQKDVRCVLSNSFGFGGTNACLLFKAFED
ncbi:MAG: beta-ketoacyl-ACP synthase II [Nitrospirae bacterium]|nr:beta-ketoacyl-ACP synthase II [Nitrospirota bacterium]